MLTKQNFVTIITIVLIVVVAAIIFKTFTIRSVDPDGMVATDEMPAVNQAELAQNYQNALAEILPRYRAVLQDSDTADVSAVREALLGLTVPTQYRDAHARLVLLLDSFADGTPAATVDVSFAELTQENAWLSNLMPDAQ